MKLSKTILKELADNPHAKIIVISETGDPLYLILPFNAYRLLGKAPQNAEALKNPQPTNPHHSLQKSVEPLTSEQFLDKINREIGEWYENQHAAAIDDSYFFNENADKQSEPKEEPVRLYLETIDE